MSTGVEMVPGVQEAKASAQQTDGEQCLCENVCNAIGDHAYMFSTNSLLSGCSRIDHGAAFRSDSAPRLLFFTRHLRYSK
jgi:hypothetical protein